MTTDSIISKVWSFCHTFRDDGVGYGDYLEQLTDLDNLPEPADLAEEIIENVEAGLASFRAAAAALGSPAWNRSNNDAAAFEPTAKTGPPGGPVAVSLQRGYMA